MIFSCGNESSEKADSGNILENLIFTVDTVMVDAGDDIISLQWNLSISTLSNDQKYLFNFNPKTNQLEVIDLEMLKLKEKFSLEREGPLGTGNPRGIHLDERGRLFMIAFNEVRIYSPSLDSMQLIKLNADNLNGLNAGESIGTEFKITDDGSMLITTYGIAKNAQQGLAIISLDGLQVKKVPFELGQKIQPFVRSFYMDGRLMSQSVESIYLNEIEGVVLASSPHFNEVHQMVLGKDSISVKKYFSEITKNSKPIPTKTKSETFEEMEALYLESRRQVDFGRFYFDAKGKMAWRVTNELDQEIGDSLIFRQVLTVFDEKMNPLGEKVLKFDAFGYKFFKDGKLWSYVNVQDELGFAVIDFKF
ncbi:MAG: DUF4221 family protein [Cyclobacterium sp.]|nr:DUF4221 family protein [Cyclobacterium sp.]